jgi:hypothetical protein
MWILNKELLLLLYIFDTVYVLLPFVLDYIDIHHGKLVLLFASSNYYNILSSFCANLKGKVFDTFAFYVLSPIYIRTAACT